MSSITNTQEQQSKQRMISETLPETPTSHTLDEDATEKREAYRPSTTPIASTTPIIVPTFRQRWIEAFKQVWPIYLASHIAFLMLTYLAALFSLDNFATNNFRIISLLDAWQRWDTKQFTAIARLGYDQSWQTAFFPFYPLLERGLSYIVHDPFVAGLIIANIVTLLLFMLLYRLVADDFDPQIAYRTILYLAIFPSAFFLVNAYNESLFIFFVLLSFYYMRRGQWWLAGLIGLLCSFTRSAGVLLMLPFCYEYLRQHNFSLRKIRIDSLGIVLIPVGVGIFALYCYHRFQDLLAFSHAQAHWGRSQDWPYMTFVYALRIIRHTPILSFFSIHTVIDLSSLVFMLVLVILCFVGPWKLARSHWSYALYAVVLYIFLISFPNPQVPLQSITRQVIELFPAFIILARMGKRPQVQFYYISIAGALGCFLLLQFLTGHWTV